MRHPVENNKFFATGFLLTVLGLVCLGLASINPDDDGFSPFGATVGYVLSILGIVYFTVHAVAALLHDHELWRRNQDHPND